MTRRPGAGFAACLVASLTLAASNGSAGDLLHDEPPDTGHMLSHDGSRMILLREERSVFDVVDTGSGESLGPFERSLVRMRWGEDGDTAYASSKDGTIYRISFGAGGAKVVPISLTGERGIPSAEKPEVLRFPVSVSPVLFARGTQGDKPLYRCKIDPSAGGKEIAARCEIVEADTRLAWRWLFAAGDRLAARIALAPSGESEFQTRTEGGEWRGVFRYLTHYTRFETFGGVREDNTVWALSNRGRESVALVRVDAATGEERVVYERRGVDVDRASVSFDGAGGSRPLLVTHFPGHQETVHFDARLEAGYAALRERLGGGPGRIDLESWDRALEFAVVEAISPAIHRRRYLLDLDAGTSRLLSAATLVGYDRPAAPARPVSFPASDGLKLHGYLTLPRRAAGAGPPPMVLMLHGGPWERARWPAPPLIRFLGSRGYAVLRLDYRGSAGYGRDFLDAGRGALSGRLQRDVLDAARWAVARGHAEAGRIALFGGSFGGFLALAVLGRHPHAFRGAIVMNAVTDAVAFWKRDWKRADRRATWRAFFGSEDLPEAMLARISPLNNARDFATPVLLLAGTRDRRVPPEHSFELFDLLRAAGKPAGLVEYRGASHDLWNSGRANREHIANQMTEFLERYLPVKDGSPHSP